MIGDIIVAAIVVAFICWIAWELYRAPIEDYSDAAADAEAVRKCVEATQPGELRPHVRAFTEVRK